MNYATKLALGVLGVGALVGVWYGDEYYTKKEEETKKHDSKVVNFESEKARKFTLVNAAGKFVFERENATANWKMLEPKAARPDQDAVNNLLSSLQSMVLETELTGTEKVVVPGSTELAQYGLDKPRLEMLVEGEDKNTHKVAVGADLNIGNANGSSFNALSVYAFTPDRKKLLVVGSSVIGNSKKMFSDFRTKLAGDFVTGDVKSIVLTRPGGVKVEMAKADKDWKIIQPKALLADANNVGLYLDKLSRLRADKITEKEALTPDILAGLTLNPPLFSVELKAADGKVLQKFDMGITKQAVFITMADGAVGSVDLNQWTDLAPELKYFRDRRVTRGIAMSEVARMTTQLGKSFQKEANSWYAAGATGAAPEPGKTAEKVANKDAGQFFSDWEFMTADNVLDASEATKLSDFGLDKPLLSFTFEFADKAKAPVKVSVGNRVPKNEKFVYIKRSDSPEVYSVETAWLETLNRMNGQGESPQAKK